MYWVMVYFDFQGKKKKILCNNGFKTKMYYNARVIHVFGICFRWCFSVFSILNFKLRNELQNGSLSYLTNIIENRSSKQWVYICGDVL